MFWAEIWKKYRNFYRKTFNFWCWNCQFIWIGVFGPIVIKLEVFFSTGFKWLLSPLLLDVAFLWLFVSKSEKMYLRIWAHNDDSDQTAQSDQNLHSAPFGFGRTCQKVFFLTLWLICVSLWCFWWGTCKGPYADLKYFLCNFEIQRNIGWDYDLTNT